jgi:hypothetical protein
MPSGSCAAAIARSFGAVAATVIAFAGEGSVAAQPEAEVRSAAVALFDDARKLMADGKFEEACPKLAESQRLDPGIGTLYNLSDCYEHVGRTASAWVGFRDTAALAMSAGQGEREKQARARATALELRLVRLKIVVAPETASAPLAVKRDGSPVASALFGTAVPLDPGRHVIHASVEGKGDWESVVALEQPGSTVVVAVPRLDLGEGVSVGGKGPGDHGLTSPSRAWQRPLAVGLVGGGILALGASLALGISARAKANVTLDDKSCSRVADSNGVTCTPDGSVQYNRALAIGDAGTAVFVVGAVCAASGVALWITSPRVVALPRPAASLRIGVGPASLAISGSF